MTLGALRHLLNAIPADQDSLPVGMLAGGTWYDLWVIHVVPIENRDGDFPCVMLLDSLDGHIAQTALLVQVPTDSAG